MKYPLLAALLLYVAPVFSQALSRTPAPRHPGELLVQLEPGYTFDRAFAGQPDFTLKKTLAADWNIHLIAFEENRLPDALALANRLPGVRAAQWNHEAASRGVPNDPSWLSQSDMDLIGMSRAWDGTTGGVMYTRDAQRGDTIVVAVLEEGYLITHPDLTPNLWHNWGEVPDNGLDDDQNGYVDDYTGWDPQTGGSGGGTGVPHGTSVAGVVGARGNNNLGVAGVNWNVKLMMMTHAAKDEDEIIAAYYYVAKMRRRYNETNGQSGAFVVATNASFGIDFGRPAQHPLWCAVYDSLGRVGVLNAGATANMNIDVDEEGDIPSTCPSNYLVSVTNVNAISDVKSPGSGYGETAIDLGSPGDGTFTTTQSNNAPIYGNFTGTSAATPHVAGAIALLYSLDCPNLANDALSNPAGCALRFKELLLRSAAPNASLVGKTVTGARLDVAAAVDSVRAACGGSSGELALLELWPNPVEKDQALHIRYETPNFAPYELRIYNMLGQLLFTDSIVPDQFSDKNYVWEDARYLPAGVYTVSLHQGRNRAVRKFRKF